jgi:hypothetical protein
MNDDFLRTWRREPRPEFARELHERLRDQEEPERRSALRPALALAAAGLAVVALFAFPAVRASALAMLDLFRVRTITAVPFDESRMAKLKSMGEARGAAIFDGEESLKNSGPPEIVSTTQAAGSLAGIDVRTPSTLPNGLTLQKIEVQKETQGSLTVHTAKLRALLDDLDLKDVEIPAGIDGQTISVHLWPAVIQHFENGGRKAHLVQAKSPEVGMPPGTDMARLGVIGLRVLGLDAAEARRVASTIDWSSTLVVPVPTNASMFREVTVRGQRGLMVTSTSVDPATGRKRDGRVVMWTEGDRVLALGGTLGEMEMMQMAESVR